MKKRNSLCLPALRERTIHTLHIKISRFYISTLSFQQDQDSNFSRKHRHQNFEEQNECMTSWDRRQKAAEINIEYKKKAPEACFFS